MGGAGDSWRRPPFDPDEDLLLLEDYDDGLSGYLRIDGGTSPKMPTEAARHLISSDAARTSLPARVAGLLPGTVSTSRDPHSDRWEAVTHLATAAVDPHPVVMVQAWCEPHPEETGRLLRQFAAAVKEAGLPPDRRTRLLVAARPSDLPDTFVDSVDTAFTTVQWWWGAVGRLDTAIVVDEARAVTTAPPRGPGALRQRILDSLRAETVAEVSGPDLRLADALTRRWDGRLSGLANTIKDCADHCHPRCDEGTSPPRRQGVGLPETVADRPMSRLRPAWSTGAVDSWDGRLRFHPCQWLGDDAMLRSLMWQAQNRVLLPLIDEARSVVASGLPAAAVHGAKHLAARYAPHEAPGTAVRRLAEMELGEIWAAVHRGDVRMSRRDKDRLGTLRYARNCLAHRTPLSDDDLHRVCRALT